jgi:solute carrier family 6 amino acid transporter-like protein 5/7/9/14
MFATAMLLTYYCSLMALAGFYLVNSFAAELPWSRCFEEWGEDCFDSESNRTVNGTPQSSSELFF